MPHPYSIDLRQRALAAFKRGGRTRQQVAAEFSVCIKTVSHWLALEAQTGDVAPRPRGGGNFSPLKGAVLEELKMLVRQRSDATVQEHFEGLVPPSASWRGCPCHRPRTAPCPPDVSTDMPTRAIHLPSPATPR